MSHEKVNERRKQHEYNLVIFIGCERKFGQKLLCMRCIIMQYTTYYTKEILLVKDITVISIEQYTFIDCKIGHLESYFEVIWR